MELENMPTRTEQNITLAFLSLYMTMTKDGYLGAILVTDSQGVPLEFRCTHPVKPNTIQKSLYGDTLVPHIGTNLCGIPLLKAIQNKPSLVIVNSDYMLNTRFGSAYPIVFVRRAGETIEVKSVDGKDAEIKQRLDSSSGKFQPIIIESHCDFDDGTIGRKILEPLFSELDPLEPFQRMSKSIEVLTQQDKKFQ
ncbi:MAG: hypothetical protein B6D41_06160 [Chloroflexi bacterium UTCFX4]|jgi:hypothetical protein|nr:MAG: hypothetical protein B6D41_06160 [Chloroflexi bacterium UTCFX4]